MKSARFFQIDSWIRATGILPLAILTGCDEPKPPRAQNETRTTSPRREREAIPSKPTPPPIDATRQEFEQQLLSLESKRGRFLAEYFSKSPLDSTLVHLSLDDVLALLAKHQYPQGSSDERAILRRFFELKGKDEAETAKKLLTERQDPELTNLLIGFVGETQPEAALELLDSVIPRGSLRSTALLNLFNVAARNDLVRAAKMVDSLRSPYERGLVAVEILCSPDVGMTPLSSFASVIIDHPATFAEKDHVFAVQAIHDHAPKEVLQTFDLNTDWQRRLIFNYLIDRGRGGNQDVKQYLDSSEGKSAFTEDERKTIMATFGANTYRARGIGHDQ